MKKIITLVLVTVFTSYLIAQNDEIGSRAIAVSGQHYTPASSLQADDYMANTLIIKVLPAHRSLCLAEQISIPSVINCFTMLGVDHIKKIYPRHKVPEKAFNKWGAPMVDLSLIYEVHYTGALELDKAIGKLYNQGVFEYVEPHYIPKTTLVPNDPKSANNTSNNGQYHLYTVHAAGTTQSGWDISTGNASVVIGITDTGTELAHVDLVNQLAHNLADPINNIDDDGDGYIDNYTGWDVGMNDNNTSWQGNAHGVAVCGDAAEQCNNGIGACGTAYNCKFMPIKISDASGALIASYDGITYAADHGCKVINCSWGGLGGGSYGQGIIDYATNNMDALVVVAAGNNGADQAFFPAGYDRVLSVAATDNSDAHAGFTNYGYSVDVCSPGVNINASWTNNSYSQNSGTSMAAPVAAGCAAVVRSFYPSYSASQTWARLKQTADNIYTLPSNSSATYANKLGTGRINLYRALTDPAGPSITYSNVNFSDNNNNVFVQNDTLRITGDFLNLLSPTVNLQSTLTVVTGAPYVTILDNSHTVGVLGTLATVNHFVDPFQVKILSTTPINQQIVFKLTMTDGLYTENTFFSVIVNVDYINVTVNDVWTTITSKGLIGYNLPGQLQGLGFIYLPYSPTATLMYESSFAVGSSSSKVDDMVRGAVNGNTDVDFSSVYSVRTVPATVSNFDLDGKFRDNVSPSPLPITVHHKAYAWSAIPHRKYVIVQYMIANTGTNALNNVYAGIMTDWDIDPSTYGSNRTGYDAVNKMGYVFYTAANGTYCGVKLLTITAPANHYGIDLIAGGAGGVDLSDGYSTAEKYTTLTTPRAVAGASGNGEDVMDVVSTGPYAIPANDSIKVAFALIAGDNLADLQASAIDAQTMYDNFGPLAVLDPVINSPVLNTYPNPTSGLTDVTYNLSQAGNCEIRLLDGSGRLLGILAKGEKSIGNYTTTFDCAVLPEGMYFIQMQTNSGLLTKKIVVVH